MMLSRLRWYKNRLAAMSVAEICFRLRETARRRFDYLYAGYLKAPLRDYGVLPEIPGLRSKLEAWNVPGQLQAQWAEDARVAQGHSFVFFHQAWPFCNPKDIWHMAPHSQKLWPRDRFCFAIDYRHDRENGDIKFVWELNRLQYLQPIAALAFKTKDKNLAQFCLQEIECWIDNNPPFFGVNWNSGIELSLRAVSILTVTTLVGEFLSRETRSKIWSSLHTHARWIDRYPSAYSSANNHLTAEGLGLLTIGALCPHFPESSRWKQKGWHILCEAMQAQILPDGTGAEQAIGYTSAVLETLLTGLKIAQAVALDIPEFYARKLALGGEHLRWLCDSANANPLIGDDDNSCVFGEYHAGDLYAASILGCIAAETNRADLSPPFSTPHFRQAVFGFGPPPDFTPYGTRCFPNGGLTVGRHMSTQGDILIALDHGPLGYLSIAAHGHADALALWLHVSSQPVFVDAGTYLYHAHEKERQSFRSTKAHNTLYLEETDSSLMSGNFNWSQKAHTKICDFETRGDYWHVEAEHDGYQKQFQTIHRRGLHVSPASGAVIKDTLISNDPHQVEISFLLHPDLTARLEEHEVIILKGEQQILRVRHESGLQTIIGRPHSPNGGWYSREFGRKEPTTRLVFKGKMQPNEAAVTHLFWSA